MKAVIGLGFGDEGKGLITNFLSNKNDLIIRYSGGQQAGHNVCIGDKNHIFSNFGSGTLKGSPTYWSKYCTFDPVAVLNELTYLKKLNIIPRLYIDGESPVTTPFDKSHNKNSDNDLKNGTCGVGVGSTINREEKFLSFTFSDLYNPSIIDIKLKNIKEFYNIHIDDIDINNFINSCYNITNNKNIFKLTYNIPKGYNKLIFEGSQGLLLDQSYGFFPYVARTNTGTKNILEIIKNNSEKIDLFLITRAYQTRHGNGPMTNIDYDIDIKNYNETNKFNKYQGEFRKTILDVSLLEYAINKDEYIRMSDNKNLVITCLDHLTDYVFTYRNELKYFKKEKDFINEICKILKINSVYISKSKFSEKVVKF